MATRIPGFTAERGLGPASIRYSSTPRGDVPAGGDIRPLFAPPTRFSPIGVPKPELCRWDCLCVSPDGCPCCTTIVRTPA
jgi:hypothetical protein